MKMNLSKMTVVLPMLTILGGLAGGFVLIQTLGGTSSARQSPVPQVDQKAFYSVEEAEQYLGFDLREPDFVPDGWHLDSILALEFPGLPVAQMNFHPAEGPGESTILVVQTPNDIPPAVAGGQPTTTRVQGVDAVKDRGSDRENLLSVSWRKDGLTLQATGIFGESLSESEFESFINSFN